jgi:methanethiol S-methyltransferase
MIFLKYFKIYSYKEMVELYIYLVSGWLSFCLLHSTMATLWFKKITTKILGKYFRFYQILYSSFFLIFLALLLKYQFQLSEPLLFHFNKIIEGLAALTIVVALVIMITASAKYFPEVTGINVFTKKSLKDKFIYSGINSVIRHPLYAGTLLFVWSLAIFFPHASSLIACIIITLYVLIGIKFEEKKLIIKYGKAYEEYISRVPMLIPGLKFSNKPV